MIVIHTTSEANWKNVEKALLRFFSIYFVLQIVPLDWKYYQQIFSIDWSHIGFDDIFRLTRYIPVIVSSHPTFYDWGIIAVIALVLSLLWGVLGKDNLDYNKLYYGLRVLLRYRLAIALIGYAFIKLFPLQSPYPSISNLNTSYGNFSAWKLFSMSLGIVPHYESFLGFVELLAGLLLLCRRTTTIGAFLVLVFTGNVFMSNLAYEGGEYVYSFYLIAIALFLLVYDVARLYRLIGLELTTAPPVWKPHFTKSFKGLRFALKTVFVLFFLVFYGLKTYTAYKNGPFRYPAKNGLSGISGIYNVAEFTLNGEVHPYALNDSVRWNDVVFEKWNTISIKSKRPVKIDSLNTEEFFKNDEQKNYELLGSGERHYYSYQADTVNKTLTLKNKNKNYPNEQLVLHYKIDNGKILLEGRNDKDDSIAVVLQKINKKYLLKETEDGRSAGLKL